MPHSRKRSSSKKYSRPKLTLSKVKLNLFSFPLEYFPDEDFFLNSVNAAVYCPGFCDPEACNKC
ncbi:MAG: hypothetical protein UV73_C0002G0122 [Candidatus Gottesmanbacteria bacterium GW2011_GWA2_43_14]|uniref:Uncharacterized protein n=1 Tax=Candidatus Gottesmanbacteria bacterium GW2011_GWA2_43_14 TaxID=1618443 RepID=A0A0G1GHZ3_9BACT|nr:MAG: hypothetical protein UV73_C0002G0122 [Candidatus Gottesmanbacteria bacterium GW2011_GWA2_43_14]